MKNDNSIKNFLNSSISTGNKKLEKRVILAPMAGLNHIGFRHLVREFKGHGLLFTGMLNSKSIPTENRYKSNFFKWNDYETSDTGVQIFGSEPQKMAEAAKRIEDEGFFCIDLNFGCSVKKFMKKNCGAYLLKDHKLALNIVEYVRKKVSFPLFIKFRAGWDEDIEKILSLAKKFEQAGADALTFHPRIAPDRRSRPPKHEYTKILKENINIPVFANGNIFTFDDAKKIIEKTSCDGISIGRIAVAKPWIFASWTSQKIFGYEIYEYTLKKALKYFTYFYGDKYGIKLFKKFYIFFCANFKFGNQFSGLFYKNTESVKDVNEKIAFLFKNKPETVERPNLNLFSR
ncbi:MAG: tRNA-dihydrouridine synthase [Deltaproteobacteria bacterium]|nr:MAG: tRNA-dihydrouridine synthase [Deltaproteobacteria bacterium]